MKFNQAAYDYATDLINEGHAVLDDRDDWSEHLPSIAFQNDFIKTHGWEKYALWHLGIDETKRAESRARYKFPYGDLRDVHRCAIISAESRAGQYKYQDIESACAHLHGMLEASVRR